MLQVTGASHVDHGLTSLILAYIIEKYQDKNEFFIDTFVLPETFGDVPCGLYGPIMGDEPVTADLTIQRAGRTWMSNMTTRPMRMVNTITVIAGPHGEDLPCILYTAFGGPLAPQEPGDPGCRDLEASKKFWNEHALALD
jgi:hypothetical protein